MDERKYRYILTTEYYVEPEILEVSINNKMRMQVEVEELEPIKISLPKEMTHK